MFYITLAVFPRGDNRLILAPKGFFRIGFALICGILLAGIGTNPPGTVPVVGILILILSVLGVFYEERWIFDRGEGMIEFRMGLLFLNKKRRYPFKEVEAFTFVTLHGGKEIDPEKETPGRGARYSLFGLFTKGGEKHNIEMIKSRLAPGLLEKAQTVSRFLRHPPGSKTHLRLDGSVLTTSWNSPDSSPN